MPVIAASESIASIHALLNHRPFTVRGNDETVKIKLKSVCDRVVIDASGKAAGAYQRISIQAGAFRVTATV